MCVWGATPRALWATDKATVLAEVFRVLHHGAYLFVVEPVSKYRDAVTGANTLPGLLTAAGFEVDLANSWGGGAGASRRPRADGVRDDRH